MCLCGSSDDECGNVGNAGIGPDADVVVAGERIRLG